MARPFENIDQGKDCPDELNKYSSQFFNDMPNQHLRDAIHKPAYALIKFEAWAQGIPPINSYHSY